MIQAMNHQMHFCRTCTGERQFLQLTVTSAEYDSPPYFPGFASTNRSTVLAETEWNSEEIVLQIEMENEKFTIRYGTSESALQELAVVDGALLNPEKVGCMSGTVAGMYATGNGEDRGHYAGFDWFEIKSKIPQQ